MTLIRSAGDACDPKLLPKFCECAAGRDDVLIIMMDGYLARFKEPKWVRRLLKNLKVWGPRTLIIAIAEAEERKNKDKTRAETVRRETSYFRDHEKHMDYRTAQKDGVPIGSGAMESQCSQNQNRFKRRGQFCSKGGFALSWRHTSGMSTTNSSISTGRRHDPRVGELLRCTLS